MKLYGIEDDNGDIYAVYMSPAEVQGHKTVELVENITCEMSDYTDPKTRTNYIRIERQAQVFDQMCKETGIKKKELAQICGKSAVQFSKYCNGSSPIPPLVWDKVKSLKKAVKGE
jgi:hypothetical protein